MLTAEEKEFVAELRVKSEWVEPKKIARLVVLIDRLSARVESFRDIEKREMILMASVVELQEWKRNSSDELVKAGMKIGTLQSHLSSLLSAVEPIEKIDKANWDKDMGMCPTWREDIKPSDLHNLSTIAAGIRGREEVNPMGKLKFEQIKKTWNSGLLLKNDEIDFLITALSRESAYREALLVILDAVDYISGACRINEMVGAVLPHTLITKARAVLDGEEKAVKEVGK